MFDNSIVRKTGQMWKVYLGILGFLAGVVTMEVGFLLSPASTVGAVVLVVGINIMLGSSAFAMAAIRCPDCRANFVWEARATAGRHPGNLFSELSKLSECPRCANQGDSAKKD
jgi:rubredoxin